MQFDLQVKLASIPRPQKIQQQVGLRHPDNLSNRAHWFSSQWAFFRRYTSCQQKSYRCRNYWKDNYGTTSSFNSNYWRQAKRYRTNYSNRKILVVGRRQVWPIPSTGKTRKSNDMLAEIRYRCFDQRSISVNKQSHPIWNNIDSVFSNGVRSNQQTIIKDRLWAKSVLSI